MNIKKLQKDKAATEQQLREILDAIAESIGPKLEEAVELMEQNPKAVQDDQEIKLLVQRAVMAVHGGHAYVAIDGKTDARNKHLRNQVIHGKGVRRSMPFYYEQLADMLVKQGVTSKSKGLTKSELEKLYFGNDNHKFEHNKWSDKEEKAKWLASDPDASFKTRKYWSKKKK